MPRPLKQFYLAMMIDHPTLPEPKISHTVIKAVSIANALKQLKISGRQACELKNGGETSWEDVHGGTHTLTINTKGMENGTNNAASGTSRSTKINSVSGSNGETE